MALKRLRLAQRRKAMGLSQEGVAEALGIERSTVGRWERVETEPQPWVRAKMAALLKVTLDELAGWMSYDQGLFGMAQRYYLLALHACREAEIPAIGAKIIGDMTQLSTALGHYDDSLSLVHTTLYSLSRDSTALVRSELLGLEARAYAQLEGREAANAARSA